MTEMEQDIYNQACTHYKKKYPYAVTFPSRYIIEEFWSDYFSKKPIYTEEGSRHEQRRLLGLHGT